MTLQKHGDEFEHLWSNPLTRRHLLQMAGMGFGATALGLNLSSCSADTSASDGSNVSVPSGGTLSVALASGVTALDPITETSGGGLAVNGLIYESLYRLDPFPPRTDITPELAAEMPSQISPTQYQIKLRSGVTFHDGTPATAEDVIYTIQRLKDPEQSPVFARFVEFIGNARALNDTEIELDLVAPTTLLAQRLVLVKVLSKAAVAESDDALKLSPIGTGPYQVEPGATDEKISVKRFIDYTGQREVSYDRIELGIVLDANARVSSLLSAQSDVIDDVPPSSYDALEDADGTEIEAMATNSPVQIYFHCGKPPFNDVRIRQAVLYSIDRDTITRDILFGFGEPAWKGFFDPDDPNFAESNTTYRYDPERARELLAEAGYENERITIEFLVPNGEVLSSQGPIIKENLSSVGFDADIIPGEYNALVARLQEGNYHMFLGAADATALGASDAEFQLRWQWYGFVPRSILFWEGEPLDRLEGLLDDALSAPDQETRKQLLAEAQDITQAEVPIGPLILKKRLTAWTDDLEGFRPLPTMGIVPDGVRG